jgi:hypothetical protein
MKDKIGRRERLIRFIGREVGGSVLPPTRKRNDQAYNQNSRGVLGRGGWPGGSPWILGTGFWGVAIRESLEYNGGSSAPLSTFWGGLSTGEAVCHRASADGNERACHRHSGAAWE